MLIVEEITSVAQFVNLQREWDDLLSRSGQYSPFLTHEWFRCCLDSYPGRKNVWILVMRNKSHVVGIAPFWLLRDTIRIIPVRRIGFITSRDTPWVDFVFQKEWQHEVLEACLGHLYCERKDIWDVLTLSQWPIESPSYRLVQTILEEQNKKRMWSLSSVTPYIPISGGWEAFLGTRSGRFRKTHRNIINRIERLRNVEVQCCRQDITVLKDILAVSERSWKHKHGLSIGSCDETDRFFERLTNLAGEKGWLMVWLLKVDGVPVAMEYDLEDGGRVYALRADYDERYRKYSPGAYLEYHIVKRLFEEGYCEYNAGPGSNTYKLHWTERVRENVALDVCNDNLKGRMIWTLEGRILPTLRRIRDLKWKWA